MEQGFCGRDCAVCDIREEYGCAGCRATNGGPPHGPCPIASCCQSGVAERRRRRIWRRFGWRHWADENGRRSWGRGCGACFGSDWGETCASGLRRR